MEDSWLNTVRAVLKKGLPQKFQSRPTSEMPQEIHSKSKDNDDQGLAYLNNLNIPKRGNNDRRRDLGSWSKKKAAKSQGNSPNSTLGRVSPPSTVTAALSTSPDDCIYNHLYSFRISIGYSKYISNIISIISLFDNSLCWAG